jgi:lysophospholipase L1-like esterase
MAMPRLARSSAAGGTIGRVVLFGDSILDNSPYTAGQPDTRAHLARLLGQDWQVDLLARDGAIMAGIPHQVQRIGEVAADPYIDVAVLSVGGNDVLRHLSLLEDSGHRRHPFDELLAIADDFEHRYEGVAASMAGRAHRILLCTIYEVQLEPASLANRVRAPLAVLNDRIFTVASRLGVEVLDLRSVCGDPEDFVLRIEPSARGARKIAEALAEVILQDYPMSKAYRCRALPRKSGT